MRATNGLLFLLATSVVRMAHAVSGVSATSLETFLVSSPNNVDIFDHVPELPSRNAESIMQTNDLTFSKLELTGKEATQLSIKFPEVHITHNDLTAIVPAPSNNNTIHSASVNFLSNQIIPCGPVNNVVFGVLDTHFSQFANTSYFSNVNVVAYKDYVGQSPPYGNTHGPSVAWIIAGNGGVVRQGARELYEFVVMNDSGNGFVYWIISALSDAINLHKELQKKGKGLVLNLSLFANQNSVLDDAIRSALNAGIIIASAAGNYGNNCNSGSPADITGICGEDNGQLDSRSNWGCPLNLCLPFCVTTPTFFNHDFHQFCGTSAASPWAAALFGEQLSRNVSQSYSQVTSATLQRSTAMQSPPNTAVSDYHVFTTDTVCPPNTTVNAIPTSTPTAMPTAYPTQSTQLFNVLKTTTSQFRHWYKLPSPTWCVDFKVSLRSSAALIGIGNASLQVNIGSKVIKIVQDGKELNSTSSTTKRGHFVAFKIFNEGNNRLIVQQEAESLSARVNAIGPLGFAGRYVTYRAAKLC